MNTLNTLQVINHLVSMNEEVTGSKPNGFKLLDLIESMYPDEDGLQMMKDYLDMTYTTQLTLSSPVEKVLNALS